MACETLTLTLVGFGSVNRALARLVARNTDWLAQEHQLVVVYHAVVARHGCWEARGAPLSAAAVAQLADEVERGNARLDGTTGQPDGVCATPTPSIQSIRDLIHRIPSGLSCLIEAIDVDYTAGEPAATYLRDALMRRVHAVSANKGPVVHHRSELMKAAMDAGVRYLHESAVMDGVPIFSTWCGGLRPGGARLVKFRGMLNSTTSMILSEMERGTTFEAAVKVAQAAGIAEADPTGDLSGMDAAVKVVALAVGLGLGEHPLRLEDVEVSGIEHITQAEVASARSAGTKLRLVACAELQNSSVRAYVKVESLSMGDPLFGLEGADAAVTIYTDRLAPITIMQKGSTVEDTAFGEFADIIRATRSQVV